jgi:hypothetical protein
MVSIKHVYGFFINVFHLERTRKSFRFLPEYKYTIALSIELSAACGTARFSARAPFALAISFLISSKAQIMACTLSGWFGSLVPMRGSMPSNSVTGTMPSGPKV